jgi:hypothetical protein
MIENPAYIGTAMYGRFHAVEPKPRLRPIRNHPAQSSRPTTRVPVPSEDWVAVAVPALVDPAVAEAARAQLEENRWRKREQSRGPGWLLQGLVVCRRCGYAYYLLGGLCLLSGQSDAIALRHLDLDLPQLGKNLLHTAVLLPPHLKARPEICIVTLKQAQDDKLFGPVLLRLITRAGRSTIRAPSE